MRVVLIGAALLALCHSPVWASLANEIGNQFGGAYVQENGASRFEDSARGMYGYSAGRYRVRWANAGGDIRPVGVKSTGPSFNVGCNGIDLQMGSIAAIVDIDGIVNQLKAMANQAGAFAFESALSTLCKDCVAILNNLSRMANSLNSMALSSCQSAQALGKSFGARISDLLNSGEVKSADSAPKEMEKSEEINAWEKMQKAALDTTESGASRLSAFGNSLQGEFNCLVINGSTCEKSAIAMKMRQGSLLRWALGHKRVKDLIPETGGDDDYSMTFAGMLRFYLGDIYGYTHIGDNGAKRREFAVFDPDANGGIEFVEALLYGAKNVLADQAGTECVGLAEADGGESGVDRELASEVGSRCVRAVLLKGGDIDNPEKSYDYKTEYAALPKALGTAVVNSFQDGVLTYTQDKIDKIVDKMDKGETLEENDKAFLARIDIASPVIPLVYNLNRHTANVLDRDDINTLAAGAAIALTARVVEEFNADIKESIDAVLNIWKAEASAEAVENDPDSGRINLEKINRFSQNLNERLRQTRVTLSDMSAAQDKQVARIGRKLQEAEELRKLMAGKRAGLRGRL